VVKVDPPISAVNDNLGGFGVGAHLNVGNVLTNDLVDGVAASAGNVTLSVITPAGASGPLPTLNTSTGAIDIAAGTPNGAYTIRYQICAVNRPNNCAQANVTLAVAQPAAVDDSSANNSIGSVVTLNVLANDLSVGGPVLVPGSVVIVGAPGSGKQLVVAGEGTWQVNGTTGAISFAPNSGFTANPTPIRYTVQDSAGNTSNPAAVTISYLNTPNAVPTSVPTLSFWGMLIAALCLIAVGSAQLSQRRKIK
jgi:CshA-type fibril repeat protein